MEKFTCLSCGSSELSFIKWVKCVEKVVIHPDARIEYDDQQIDDTEMLGAEYRYVCACCGKPPLLYGHYVENEDELIEYLNMTLDVRTQMQIKYEALVALDIETSGVERI